MDRRSHLVWKIKGNIVLQLIHSGNPAIIAKYLLDLVSKRSQIVADSIVAQIVVALKDSLSAETGSAPGRRAGCSRSDDRPGAATRTAA